MIINLKLSDEQVRHKINEIKPMHEVLLLMAEVLADPESQAMTQLAEWRARASAVAGKGKKP